MLLVKPKDQQGPWTYVSLDGLPPLCLSAYDGNHALSPTSGRARLIARDFSHQTKMINPVP